ncbi:MAG: hypothetical protein AAFW89_06515 [Bacteroidota bacterium]
MKAKSFSFLLIIGLFTLATSELKAQDVPTQIAERFFENYKNKGSDDAIDSLYASNKWISRAADALANLKSQISGLNEDYVGTYYGYELIVEKKLGDSFALQSYLVKYDRQPIRFTFLFYRPNEEWMLYSFQYDGNLGEELKEAANIYFLDLN